MVFSSAPSACSPTESSARRSCVARAPSVLKAQLQKDQADVVLLARETLRHADFVFDAAQQLDTVGTSVLAPTALNEQSTCPCSISAPCAIASLTRLTAAARGCTKSDASAGTARAEPAEVDLRACRPVDASCVIMRKSD